MATGKDIFWEQNFCPLCFRHWVVCYCDKEKIKEEFEKNERTKQTLQEVHGKRS